MDEPVLRFVNGVYIFDAGDYAVEFEDVERDRGHLRATVTIRTPLGAVYERTTGFVTDSRTRWAWAQSAAQRDGHDAGGIADLLLLAVTALELEVAPPIDVPALQSIPDLIAATDLDDHYLVDGLLEQGDSVILAGAAKAGKTILVMNLALDVTTGTDFLGHWAVLERSDGKPHRVAIIQAEDSPRTIARRALRMSTEWPNTVEVHVGPFALSERNLVATVERFSGYSLVIADPLLLVAPVENLNDAAEVRKALTPWQRLARDSGAAVVLVHHIRKQSPEAGAAPGHEMLGSQQLLAVPDSFILFREPHQGIAPSLKDAEFHWEELGRHRTRRNPA